MKNKKIDNLFRNKLVQHEVAPSAAVWSKLEGKMATKKAGYRVYWRVAAVLILLVASVFALYDFNGDKTTVATTEDVKATENDAKIIEDKINNNSEPQLADTEIVTKDEKEVVEDIPKQIIKRKISPIAVQQQVKKKKMIDFTVPKEQQELIADKTAEKEENLVKKDAIKLIDKIEDDKAVAMVENTQETQNKSYDFGPKVVITFKKEKVGEKEAIASIKDDKNKKHKLFRKVLNFAKDIKSKNIGIASIREAKDEIFTSRAKKRNQQVNPK